MEEKINQILAYSLLAAKNVLTLEDAALLTGLSKSTLYKLTCSHQIRAGSMDEAKPSGQREGNRGAGGKLCSSIW